MVRDSRAVFAAPRDVEQQKQQAQRNAYAAIGLRAGGLVITATLIGCLLRGNSASGSGRDSSMRDGAAPDPNMGDTGYSSCSS